MTKFFNLALVLLFAASAPVHTSYASVAGSIQCPHHVSESGPNEYRSLGTYQIPNVRVPDPENPAVMLQGPKFVEKIVKKYAPEATFSTDMLAMVDQVYKKIKSTRFSPVNKAKMFGEFATELDPVFEKMIARFPDRGSRNGTNLVNWGKRYQAVEDVKRIKFVFSMSVADLENFGIEDFVHAQPSEMFMTTVGTRQRQTHMPLIEYPKYIESYIGAKMNLGEDLSKLWNNIPDSAPGGVLSIKDIRDITSYNVWPMYLKNHDVRHIHYGLSHPFALATMMRATRSRIPLRYTMLGGLYEGVDRFQYSQESAINRFFATEISNSNLFPNISRNMDLEESMIMLGYLPEAKLKELAARLPSGAQFVEFANQLVNWKPVLIDTRNLRGLALDGAGRRLRTPRMDLEEDAKDAVFRFQRLHLQSDALKEKIRLNPNLELTEDEKMLLWMMNYQLDPTSPEIVIEGLRFKNDGRAHYSRSDDLNAPIGVGDR